MNNEISLANCNACRLTAIMVINGQVYESDENHQECLEMYFADNKIQSPFNYDYDHPEIYDRELNKAMKKTFEMFERHEAYGFDHFECNDGNVLVAHDKETFEINCSWMHEYARQHDMRVAYFEDYTNRDWKVTVVA